MDPLTIMVRLGLALLVGVMLGLDRDLRGKPAGVRTHSMVAIGSAVVLMSGIAISTNDPAGASRVIQGLITGIGFLGAGVIIHYESEGRIEGLTTAASIWVAAALGGASGAGQTELVLLALVAAMIVLLAGGPFERALERHLRGRENNRDR